MSIVENVHESNNNEYVYIQSYHIDEIPHAIAIPIVNAQEYKENNEFKIQDEYRQQNNNIYNNENRIQVNNVCNLTTKLKIIEILFLNISLVLDVFALNAHFYKYICIFDIISISIILFIYLIKLLVTKRIGLLLSVIYITCYIIKLILYPLIMSYYLWHDTNNDFINNNFILYFILSINIGLHIYIQFLGLIYITLLCNSNIEIDF